MEVLSNSKWKEVKNQLLGDAAIVEMVSGDHMTLCRYKISEKINIPLHSHEYEQSIYVSHGKMNLVVDGELISMKSGDAYIILKNVKHSAEIVEIPFESIESYYPKREDLLEK
ncbi:cupin domain-containing protein [Acetivibrio mesophilus]|uniref:Cupin domain-containing protein n=1 Tax=Acetivibrio mesophilus TaxID=2487273 RepID=A0A4Q0I251_9FIRM|nr:cupin domain-containing protein [Acetivibrio mesophilus]ODM26713.1 hypothetical protein A7W90_11085 [Clostridium sp. Bc-iso-3]RXE58263.1 cupin domain-containing protein [Acetivibrio mesophilus]HHV30573.1 cupin domain-containing protein [Clostridium sp.]HOA79444.1 cupin domain-containing protein [Defluviitaleaceae bacterium]